MQTLARIATPAPEPTAYGCSRVQPCLAAPSRSSSTFADGAIDLARPEGRTSAMSRLLLTSTFAALATACASAQPLPDPVETAAAPEEWRATQPEPGELAELVTPKFERFTLDNGLTVLVSERHELPLVSVNVAYRAGSAADPEGKEGLAGLTYQLLLEGAGKLDALALDNAFADLGSSVGASVGQDGALVGVQILRRNLDQAGALLADIVLRPRFDAASFQHRKEQLLASLAFQVGSPGYLAGEAFAATVYGPHHPYGRLSSGTPTSVSGLQLADAKRFYADAAGPREAALILAGDISVAEARELAQRWFGTWKGKAKAVAAPKAPAVPARGQVVFVPKAGLAQTVIMVGRPAIAAGDPDEYALNLASAVFGGMFGSRLNMNLREDKGYTYGARSYVDSRLGVGTLVASSSVRADVTGASLSEFMKELDGIRSRPITTDELEAAREGRIRSMPGSFESVGGLAGAAANLFWMNRPLDHYEQMIDAYENATAEQVQQAADRFLDPSLMQIVLVGDLDHIVDQVTPLGLGPLLQRAAIPATPTAKK